MTKAPLPDQVEICARSLDGQPCRGVIFRRGVDATLPYCQKCGAEEPGVVFVKAAGLAAAILAESPEGGNDGISG
jgi:hypothetical protein